MQNHGKAYSLLTGRKWSWLRHVFMVSILAALLLLPGNGLEVALEGQAGAATINLLLNIVFLFFLVLANYFNLLLLVPRFLARGKFLPYIILVTGVIAIVFCLLLFIDRTLLAILYPTGQKGLSILDFTGFLFICWMVMGFFSACRLLQYWALSQIRIQELEATVHHRSEITAQPTHPTEEEKDPVIYVRADRKYHSIRLEELMYIEGMKDYAILHLMDESQITTAMNIKTIHSQLPQHQFARISRSFIVNVQKISSFDNHAVYIGKEELPIGESYREPFFDQFVKDKVVAR